ncbi:MAG: S-methyl-5'-thioinosine phosphorylase [Wenzhouxiangellaceae bacterium]|nr:S-methyl-5'-thioinosine phosphorylase [Wenzhouxiangellaceae bacterium]
MKLGIIGGTGALGLFESGPGTAVTTPFGAPSARPRRVEIEGRGCWFLARHGEPHRIPPHRVNYRANIQALKNLGVDSILAINAVGGLSPAFEAGALVAPDQLIDLTWGRSHTFSDGGSAPLRHIDFTAPFDGPLRARVLAAATDAGCALHDGAVHVVTQGPRLETAAEVRWLSAMGGELVGMTAMPEAALAREAGLDYASICAVANAGAGLSEGPITEQAIAEVLERAMLEVGQVIRALLRTLPPGDEA